MKQKWTLLLKKIKRKLIKGQIAWSCPQLIRSPTQKIILHGSQYSYIICFQPFCF